jgi:hypothetical protein
MIHLVQDRNRGGGVLFSTALEFVVSLKGGNFLST